MSTMDSGWGRGGAGRGGRVLPRVSRPVFLLALVAGGVAGVAATGPDASVAAIGAAGPELTRLLRAMAGIKMLLAAVAVASVFWRLGGGIGVGRLAAYAAAGAVMVAGPGLIWQMAHVGAGALLLHGGLVVTLVLLWRDPGTAARLARLVATRRALAG